MTRRRAQLRSGMPEGIGIHHRRAIQIRSPDAGTAVGAAAVAGGGEGLQGGEAAGAAEHAHTVDAHVGVPGDGARVGIVTAVHTNPARGGGHLLGASHIGDAALRGDLSRKQKQRQTRPRMGSMHVRSHKRHCIHFILACLSHMSGSVCLQVNLSHVYLSPFCVLLDG